MYKVETQKGHFYGCKGIPCRCEIRGYWYLFWITAFSSFLEFLVAKFFANSAAAEADSLHSYMHSLSYLLVIKVSNIISRDNFTIDQELHLRSKYGLGQAVLLLIALVWVAVEAMQKLFHLTPVVGGFMILSVMAGFVGNMFALIILRRNKKSHDNYKLLTLDTLADFGISVVMLAVSLVLFFSPSIPLLVKHYREIQFIDPILSIAVVLWIGRLGYKLFVTKTMVNF